ncbi:ABC transporter substrate-binding protein [Alkalicoccus daliensis]|uniref:Putative spermidine/putrescine transport system substrate-binding protein n=1 Tax=Alkalicoccus daliensis TaxID=745820 RepID=A0A1H0K8F8_9BACI|nr:ABC transporter substrate-binding protein [Alkalicoccus daliensis]SDO52318.1 putative spermidine/putrescine transport system substrate-binding protein [Alkalicoccus daliensis]
MNKWYPLLFGAASLTAGCAENNTADVETQQERDWEEIVEEAAGKEVGIYMWGGDEGINAYMDEVVAPALEEQYDISFQRYPMDTPEFLSRLMTEKEAGQQDGAADILWINGENFRNAKENELLYGSFASILPNMEEAVNTEAPYIEYDMGIEVDEMEVPWGNVQYAFQFRDEENPPETLEELFYWAEENPGEFTYPNVSNDTGNGFIRHIIHHVAEDPEEVTEFNEAWIEENGDEVWEILRSLQPSLWRNGETYPETLSQQDQLFANGEVSATLGFNEYRAESLIEQGTFPEDTQTVGLSSGSISSTHYLSMAFNTQEPEAALVAINYMLSPEAQIAKLDPSMWGEGHILDLNKLTEEEVEEIESLVGEEVVPQEEALPELDARYISWIQENWEQEVVQQR